MKKIKEDQPHIVMSCKGSIDLIIKNKTKGVFYCPNYDDKILLIENIKSYKETYFDTWKDFEDYVKEVY